MCGPSLANGPWMAANEHTHTHTDTETGTSRVQFEVDEEFDKLLIVTKIECQKVCRKNLQTVKKSSE